MKYKINVQCHGKKIKPVINYPKKDYEHTKYCNYKYLNYRCSECSDNIYVTIRTRKQLKKAVEK